MTTLETIVKDSYLKGGYIIPSKYCSDNEIQKAKLEKRFAFDRDGNGYIRKVNTLMDYFHNNETYLKFLDHLNKDLQKITLNKKNNIVEVYNNKPSTSILLDNNNVIQLKFKIEK